MPFTDQDFLIQVDDDEYEDLPPRPKQEIIDSIKAWRLSDNEQKEPATLETPYRSMPIPPAPKRPFWNVRSPILQLVVGLIAISVGGGIIYEVFLGIMHVFAVFGDYAQAHFEHKPPLDNLTDRFGIGLLYTIMPIFVIMVIGYVLRFLYLATQFVGRLVLKADQE